jgi:hypothetical protein
MNAIATAVSDWGVAAWTAFAAGMSSLLMWVPKLLGAIVILLVGWALANLAYTVTAKVLGFVRFDHLLERTGIDQALERAKVRRHPTAVVATLAKWVVLLVTVSVAADALGLLALSAGIGTVIAYVPNVIAAVVILALGLLLAGFVRDLVKGTSASAGFGTAEGLGEAAYWVVAVFAALGAIGQLNIAPALVQTLYTGAVAAAALALGLAFGLGLRDQARDVMAGRVLADQVGPGDDVACEGIQGRIRQIGMVRTLIGLESGAIVAIANRKLIDHDLTISAASAAQRPPRITIVPTTPAAEQPERNSTQP